MPTLTAQDGCKVNISADALAMLKAIELASGRKDAEILDAAIETQRVALLKGAWKAGAK